MTVKAAQIINDKKDKSKRMPTARLPVELEYWYILPAVRKTLAKNLKELGKLRQKEVADILGISESAVSQYLKGSRAGLELDDGSEIEMPDWLIETIKESTLKIIANKDNRLVFLAEINDILYKIREKPTHFLCKVHRAFGIAEKECTICLTSLNIA